MSARLAALCAGGTGRRRITAAAFEAMARKVAAADALVPQLQRDASMFQSLERHSCPVGAHRDWWTEPDPNAGECCPWCAAAGADVLRSELGLAEHCLREERRVCAGLQEQVMRLRNRLADLRRASGRVWRAGAEDDTRPLVTLPPWTATGPVPDFSEAVTQKLPVCYPAAQLAGGRGAG